MSIRNCNGKWVSFSDGNWFLLCRKFHHSWASAYFRFLVIHNVRYSSGLCCLDVLSRCISSSLGLSNDNKVWKKQKESSIDIIMHGKSNGLFDGDAFVNTSAPPFFVVIVPSMFSTESLKLQSNDFTKHMQYAIVRKRSHLSTNGSILISRVDDIAPTMIGPLNSHRNNNSSLPKTFSSNHWNGKTFWFDSLNNGDAAAAVCHCCLVSVQKHPPSSANGKRRANACTAFDATENWKATAKLSPPLSLTLFGRESETKKWKSFKLNIRYSVDYKHKSVYT